MTAYLRILFDLGHIQVQDYSTFSVRVSPLSLAHARDTTAGTGLAGDTEQGNLLWVKIAPVNCCFLVEAPVKHTAVTCSCYEPDNESCILRDDSVSGVQQITALDVGRKHVDPARGAVFGRSPTVCHLVVQLFQDFGAMAWGASTKRVFAGGMVGDMGNIWHCKIRDVHQIPFHRISFGRNTRETPFLLQPPQVDWSERGCCLDCLAPHPPYIQ